MSEPVDTLFRLVCAMPTYREGPLARSALESVLGHVDEVIVWEGPAGAVHVPDVAPETPLVELAELGAHTRVDTWTADHDKRTAMLKYAKERWHDRPLWIVWLDADEILVNAGGIRDAIRAQMWEDEVQGRSIVKPDNTPTGGLVIRYVEADGSVSKEWGRCIRADVIRRYVVSNLMLETVLGQQLRLGRRQEHAGEWRDPRARVHGEYLVLDPPLPGEPCFVHRSHLRHPARAALRLHEAEHERLVELGLPTA